MKQKNTHKRIKKKNPKRKKQPFLIESIKGLIQHQIFVNLNIIHAGSLRTHGGGGANTTCIIITIKQIHGDVLTLRLCNISQEINIPNHLNQ